MELDWIWMDIVHASWIWIWIWIERSWIGLDRIVKNLSMKTSSLKLSKRSKARQNSFRNYSDIFFAQVNIGVTTGHQRSNFPKIDIVPETPKYLGNYAS